MSTGTQIHENHKIHSQKLLARINHTGDEVLKSIKDAEQAYWDKVIPSVLNQLISDLQVVVHHLQLIEIKANAEKSAKAELQNVIDILSKIAYELQQEFGKISDIPKSLLETTVPQIINVAQTLLGVIEDDKLHAYKDEEVELLNSTLVALNQVSTVLQMDKPDEIKNFVVRKLEQLNQALNEIDLENPHAFDNLKKHITRANVQTPKMIHHLLKQSNNYNGNVKSEILNTADLIHQACSKLVVDMQGARNVREAELHLRYAYNWFCSIVIKLISYLVAESKGLQAPDNLITLARYLASQASGFITRDIEYIHSDTVVSAGKQ